MGIGGHVLGDKKLRQLSERTGLPLNRAIRRNRECEGVVWNEDGTCTHYEIDWESGGAIPVTGKVWHWTSCPRSQS